MSEIAAIAFSAAAVRSRPDEVDLHTEPLSIVVTYPRATCRRYTRRAFPLIMYVVAEFSRERAASRASKRVSKRGSFEAPNSTRGASLFATVDTGNKFSRK